MNGQYLEYTPGVGTSTTNSHHGLQHRLQKQPECTAANLLENYNSEKLLSLGGPCEAVQSEFPLNVKLSHFASQ